MSTVRVLVVHGTRPEAIKLAPLVDALVRSERYEVRIAVTGQHREMLDQVHAAFGLRPDLDLDLQRAGQTPLDVTARALLGLDPAIAGLDPDVVVVQGDTATTFAAAFAAFHRRVPVVHLEAGLRTQDPSSPFPEEATRRLVTRLAALHLAPTAGCRANLESEGVDPRTVVVTGNTVVDALTATLARHGASREPLIPGLPDDGRRVVVVTAHRREAWGAGLRRIGEAAAEVARRAPDTWIVVPAHRNPTVRDDLLPPLAGLPNVVVTEPLGYVPFVRLLARAHLVVTDSGGIQEEAPSLGVPVLVTREVTERPEAVAAGAVALVGTHRDTIAHTTLRLLNDSSAHARMARAANPYGDGRAAERCVAALDHLFGIADRPADFQPATMRDSGSGHAHAGPGVGRALSYQHIV